MDIIEIKNTYGINNHRMSLLKKLENLLFKLNKEFSNYRILIYGSFISDKEFPSDIDLMISLEATPSDSGFNKYKCAKELVEEGIDIFQVTFKMSFCDFKEIMGAEAMKNHYNNVEKNIKKGISCNDYIEVTVLKIV